MTPVNEHPPVRLKQEELNTIRLTVPALADYDAIALKRRRNRDCSAGPLNRECRVPAGNLRKHVVPFLRIYDTDEYLY